VFSLEVGAVGVRVFVSALAVWIWKLDAIWQLSALLRILRHMKPTWRLSGMPVNRGIMMF